MNIALLYYDGFSGFETVIMALLFNQHNLIAIALENREYRSVEFAVELAEQMGLYQTREEYEADLNWFKNSR